VTNFCGQFMLSTKSICL